MDAKQFGEFIKELRKKHMSREKFAERYRRHVNTIKAYENDGRLPSVDHLFALAVETNYDFLKLVVMRLEVAQLEQQLPDDIDIAAVWEQSPFYNLGEDQEGFVQLNIISDTMAPTIKPGALVIYDPLRKNLKDGQMYVFSFDNGQQVRRVQTTIHGGIKLLCDNRVYPPEQLDKSETDHLQVLGAVITVTNYFG